MPTTADAIVIGAGVIGSSIALELARGGRRVVVVDKAGGVGHGSTSASSAIVRFNYSTWAGVAASWESWHGWHDWSGHLRHRDDAGLAEFVRTGMLVLSPDAAAPGRVTGLFDQAGISWELWSSDELARRLPALDRGAYGPPKPVDSEEFFADAHGKLGGLYTPDAGYISDPQLAAHNLAEAAMALGATYLLRRRVTAIARADSSWRVGTGDGAAIEAPVVVNAAGPWSSGVNAVAGVGSDFNVTSRPLQQEVHRLATAAGLGDCSSEAVTVADPDLGVYMRGDRGGLLVGGMEPACDPLVWLDDPDAASVQPSVPVFEAQTLRASRRQPDARVPNQPNGIVGVYDASTDWTPIYDKTSEPGFYVAMGTSGNQFKNAPVAGALMTAIIDAVESGRDHDADPVVFTGQRTGLTIDLSAFSRLRRVEPDAPASVLG